jgi:hypothetical protein
MNPRLICGSRFQIKPCVLTIALFISTGATCDCLGQEQTPLTAQTKPLTLENYAPFLEWHRPR